MTEHEEWRPIVGYEALYDISSLGRVRNARTGLVRKPWLGGHYPSVTLKKDGVAKTQFLHRFVAAAFLGPKPELGGERVDICHNDGDAFNNRADNLRYDTHRNNQRQMVADGTSNLSRTHCKRGHEWTPENTWHHKSRGRTTRVCRACHYMRREQQRARSDSGYSQSA